ncbi:hypothetical protein C8R46DRAFT_541262 [Mycena filopes]|nr:hypothetical protein C8R46DRAFT_541262 [Mycena filopes]
MPAPSLPDELISEILSPALKVSDEVFADTKHVSPFANPDSESTSAYLLVCKSWLRVATPLLYNVVVIRSKAQAKALGLVLAKNALLGPFIRKLRVEGGYGAPMGTILKCSPNITDLCMTLEIWATDNPSGLCKGLPLISPERLILHGDRRRGTNKMATSLQEALLRSIPKWKRLTVAEFAVSVAWNIRPIVDALAGVKILERVKLSSGDIFLAYELLSGCPLKVIQVDAPSVPGYILSQLDGAPHIKALVQLATPSNPTRTNVDAQPVIQSWDFARNPFASASQEVQENIWKRVLSFAMLRDKPAERWGRSVTHPKLPFLLVSKAFNRLALPYYYTHVELDDMTSTCQFAAVLQHHPTVASQVRTLSGSFLDYDDWDTGDWASDLKPDKAAGAAALLAVFSQATGLEQVSDSFNGELEFKSSSRRFYFLMNSSSMPWDAFAAMADNSGKTIQRFVKPIDAQQDVSPAIFAQLTALRVLDWMSDTSFVSDPAQTPFDGLPNLTTLQISHVHPSFLTALTRMNLPSLKIVLLAEHTSGATEGFLRAHGSKLAGLMISCATLDNLHQ